MSNIVELIEQLCPDGVEYKELGKLANFIRGITYSKIDEKNEKNDVHKVLRANNISLSTNTVNFNDIKFISNSVKVRDNQKLIANDILICAASGSKAHVGKVAFIHNEIDYTFGGFMAVLRTHKILNARFLFHLLVGSNFAMYLNTALNTTTINNLNARIMNGFTIPIPPLAIQQEIVAILDQFTQLQAELQAELQARRAQYEYYRNELLNFEGKEVEWKTLGEICKIGDGLHGTPIYNDLGNYHFINGNNLSSGKIIFDKNTKKVDDSIYAKYGISFSSENTIFMSINGTIGSVSIYNNENVVLGKSVAYFNIKTNCLNSKYLFYLLQTDFAKEYYERQKTGSTIKNLGLKSLREFRIPIPPIEEQNRIVAILDQFDKLVNDKKEGLPAEIEARRKQYEYYRGKLLDFKPLAQ